MRQMVGHDIRCLTSDDGCMDLGVKRFAPGERRLIHVDIILALVEFFHDLFHPDSIAATEKIPIRKFGWSSERNRRRETRRKAVNSFFHWGKHLFWYKKNWVTEQGIST